MALKQLLNEYCSLLVSPELLKQVQLQFLKPLMLHYFRAKLSLQCNLLFRIYFLLNLEDLCTELFV